MFDTMIVTNGICIALPSGSEHRQLRSHPCQIEVIKKLGQHAAYINFVEDTSKNRPDVGQMYEINFYGGVESN